MQVCQLYAASIISCLVIQSPDGKNMEIDVISKSDCGRVVLVGHNSGDTSLNFFSLDLAFEV